VKGLIILVKSVALNKKKGATGLGGSKAKGYRERGEKKRPDNA